MVSVCSVHCVQVGAGGPLLEPGRVLQIHEKLSSPSRKLPLHEKLRRHNEKLAKAELLRQALLASKTDKLKELFRRVSCDELCQCTVQTPALW